MIWWALLSWGVWGIFACIFYGRRVVLHGSQGCMALFTIGCGPLVWLAMFLVWLLDIWRNRR